MMKEKSLSFERCQIVVLLFLVNTSTLKQDLKASSNKVSCCLSISDIKAKLNECSSPWTSTSKNTAFKVLLSMRFKKLLKKASPVILEPIWLLKNYSFLIVLGDVNGHIFCTSWTVSKVLSHVKHNNRLKYNSFAGCLLCYSFTSSLKGRWLSSWQFIHYEIS